MTLLGDGLIIPALALALIGWLVPKMLSLFWPEGVKALFLLAFMATLIMLALGLAFFVVLYAWQGVPLATLFTPGWAAGLVHFGRLGMISALLWGPIMVLSVAGLPRHWVKETW